MRLSRRRLHTLRVTDVMVAQGQPQNFELTPQRKYGKERLLRVSIELPLRMQLGCELMKSLGPVLTAFLTAGVGNLFFLAEAKRIFITSFVAHIYLR